MHFLGFSNKTKLGEEVSDKQLDFQLSTLHLKKNIPLEFNNSKAEIKYYSIIEKKPNACRMS